jgi:glycine oxidase
MLLFGGPVGALPHVLIGGDHYLIPRRDGHILAGSTLEEAGFDDRPTAAANQQLMAAALALWPPLAQMPLIAQWAGLRPATADGFPLLGEDARIKGLYYCTGHYRLGLALAPASAKHVAAMVGEAQGAHLAAAYR